MTFTATWIDRYALRRVWPVWVAAVVCSWIAVSARWGPDWPAQEFRADLARTSALLFWDNNWYAGQAVVGYSVLYPLVAGVLGAAASGALAGVSCVWSGTRLVGDLELGRARHVAVNSAVICVVAGLLLIGQVPFLFGTACGLCALRAFARRKPVGAAGWAAACSLFSPLAGSFLLLGALGLTASAGWRRVVPFAAAATGSVVAAVLGGASGPMPCPWTSLACVMLFCGGVVVLVPRDNVGVDRILRRLAAGYGLAAIAAFAVPNPIGGNITRFGRLVAVPLACYLLCRTDWRRLAGIGVAAIAGLVWAMLPVVGSISTGAADPSQRAAYYRGLLGFLHNQNPALGRLEIPFTHDHWEARWVAAAFPIARGWERQSDLEYNKVLYAPLTPARYRRWLTTTAVRFVALPDVLLDEGGTAEGRLLQHPPRYLVPVWHDANWRVWRVVGATPLATGAGSITDLDADSIELQFRHAGSAVVRIRASRLWQLTTGQGCVGATPGGWLRITSPVAGRITVAARPNPSIFGVASDCTP